MTNQMDGSIEIAVSASMFEVMKIAFELAEAGAPGDTNAGRQALDTAPIREPDAMRLLRFASKEEAVLFAQCLEVGGEGNPDISDDQWDELQTVCNTLLH